MGGSITSLYSGAGFSGSSYAEINGKKYVFPAGSNISIVNGTIYINGKIWTGDAKQNSQLEKDLAIAQKIELHIHVDEKDKNKNNVEANAGTVIVHGSVQTLQSVSGDVTVNGDVNGDVQTTSGDIKIGQSVGKSVTSTSGDVQARTIYGAVSTVSGDISKR